MNMCGFYHIGIKKKKFSNCEEKKIIGSTLEFYVLVLLYFIVNLFYLITYVDL